MRVPGPLLGRLLTIAMGVAACATACRGPDAFYRDGGTTGRGGNGGSGSGNGGTFGTGQGGSGGIVLTGTGGSVGNGGTTGQGGSVGNGGTTGTGGTFGTGLGGSGGSATGTGGRGGTGGTGVADAGMEARPPCTSCALKVMYSCTSMDASAAALTLQIVNTSAITVPWADVTVRYWYTADAATQKLECDYAVLVCGGIGLTVNNTSMARSYFELGFTGVAGSLDAAGNSGNIQLRLHNEPYTTFDQTNDYSFDCSMKGVSVESAKITAYVRGALVWGTEPP